MRFFTDTEPDLLSEVKAVAMDMNASYNRLVEESLTHARIVYDRYHMQAQYGKDVLGSIRLEEARKHQKASRMLKETTASEEDPLRKRASLQEAKEESKKYSAVKKARWTILSSSDKMSQTKYDSLEEILNEHKDLAVCYALKEDMNSLFMLRDESLAREGWTKWYEAAKTSGIPQL